MERDWLLEGLFKEGDTMVLASPPKTGKSLAGLDLALSAVTEGEWFGYQCSDYVFPEDGESCPRDVLYLNLENPKDEQTERLRLAMKERDISGDEVRDHLYVLNLKGTRAAWDLEALWEEVVKLLKWARVDRFDYIIVDPIYSLIDGDENSNRSMAQFFTQLAEFRDEFGGALVLTHHFIKAWRGIKDSHADRIAGAGTISRSPEVIATLTPRGSRVELNITARRHDCHDVKGRMYRAEGSRFIECDADDEITEVPLDPNESVTRAAIAELSKLGPVKVQELADFLGKHRSTITERVKKYGYSIKRGIVLAPNVGGEVRTTNNNPPTHSSGGVDGDGGGPPKGGPPPTTNHSPALDIPEIERESER